eukprot:scaffold29883_cov48-Attheya_sp.AAC.9
MRTLRRLWDLMRWQGVLMSAKSAKVGVALNIEQKEHHPCDSRHRSDNSAAQRIRVVKIPHAMQCKKQERSLSNWHAGHQ